MPESAELLDDDYEIVDAPTRRKRPVKYLPGPVIDGFEALLAAIDAGQRIWVYNRSWHASWVGNQSMQTLRRQAASGIIRRAIINPMYVRWLQDELESALKEINDV